VGLRLNDIEVATDLVRERVVDLAVSRDGGHLPSGAVGEEGVAVALTKTQARSRQ